MCVSRKLMDHIDEMIKLHKKCRIQVSAMDFCRRPENTLEVRGVKWLCIASSCCPLGTCISTSSLPSMLLLL